MAAVANVHLKPAVERGPDDVMNFALPIDEATGMARERMGQDVAGAQLWYHPLQDCIGVLAIGAALGQAPQRAEVHVKGKLGAPADLRRHLQNLDAPARKAADLGMALDA